jgi:mannose-1-phosphate guanylyltransferase
MLATIILAGGVGKRLWPLSSPQLPKQFIKLIDDFSLFQHAVMNAELIDKNLLIIITSNEFESLVIEQLQQLKIRNYYLILEPVSKNTYNSITIAAKFIDKFFPKYQLLILPSDHFIENFYLLINTIENQKISTSDSIALFAVPPLNPNHNYGYVKLKSLEKGTLSRVVNFIEKPVNSEKYIDDGYLWNSGIFLINSDNYLKEIDKDDSENLITFDKLIDNINPYQNIIKLSKFYMNLLDDISFDYKVLEKIDNLSAYNISLNWHDLGSWQTLIEYLSIKSVNNQEKWGYYQSLNQQIKIYSIISGKYVDIIYNNKTTYKVVMGNGYIVKDGLIIKIKQDDIYDNEYGDIRIINNNFITLNILEINISEIMQISDKYA